MSKEIRMELERLVKMGNQDTEGPQVQKKLEEIEWTPLRFVCSVKVWQALRIPWAGWPNKESNVSWE